MSLLTMIFRLVSWVLELLGSLLTWSTRCFRSHPSRMRCLDRIWLTESRTNLGYITGIMVLDGCTIADVRRAWQCALESRDSRGDLRWDRLAMMPIHGCWVRDELFSVERQVVAAREPAPRTWTDLRAHLAAMLATCPPYDRPLWQAEVIEGFEKHETVMLFRIQHCYADGAALVEFVHSFFDQTAPLQHQQQQQQQQQGSPQRQLSPPTFFASMRNNILVNVLSVILLPFVMLRLGLERADASVLHGPPLTGSKRVAWMEEDFDLEEVKMVKDAFGVTINDLMCTIVAGALGAVAAEAACVASKNNSNNNKKGNSKKISNSRNNSSSGVGGVRAMSASIPVNVRGAGEEIRMENCFAVVKLPLPTNEVDPVKRLRMFQRMARAMKRSPEPLVMARAVELLRLLPSLLVTSVLDFCANKSTLVVTNVRCPSDCTIQGRRLRRVAFWVPQRADIGVGVSIFSYGTKIGLGVASDSGVLPDPQVLCDKFGYEYQMLRDAALGKAKRVERSPSLTERGSLGLAPTGEADDDAGAVSANVATTAAIGGGGGGRAKMKKSAGVEQQAEGNAEGGGKGKKKKR